MTDFDEQLSLAFQSDADVADFLEHIGDSEGAQELRQAGVRGQGASDWFTQPWKQPQHVYGFIAEGASTKEPIEIEPAASITADPSLIGKRVKVTLDAFQVHRYPGFGTKRILFDFQGRDQAAGDAQNLRFASVLHASDGANAAVSGMPVFTGVTVPANGLSFRAKTVFLGAAGDEAIIDVLESSIFKDGLKLLGTVQPALPQLVALAGGVTKTLLKRPYNKQVQLVDLGLDFSSTRTSIRLRRGSYIIVQVPGAGAWRWSDWRFDPNLLAVVDASGMKAPHNVIVFAVSASSATEAKSASEPQGGATP